MLGRCLIALMIAGAPAVAAQPLAETRPFPEATANLAVNPNFNTGISGWSSSFLTASWSNLDRSGSTSSGSALLRNQDAVANVGGYFHQCITVVPGRGYAVGASWMAPAGQTRTGTQWTTYSYGASCWTPTDRPISSSARI